jgi:Ca2+:H+ antiporter
VAAADLPLSRLATQVLDRIDGAAEREGREEATDRALLASLLAEPKGRVAQVIQPNSTAMTALRAALNADPGRVEPRASRRSSEPKPDRERSVPRPSRTTPPAPAPSRPARGRRWSLLLLLAVPASVVLARLDASAIAVFLAACIGVLPLAALMGEATEALAERTGPTIGGLLNATFGNAAELIIALAALRAGLVDLVKASITGSILGNLLLILGLSCVAAGSGRTIVRFSRTNAGMSAAMLALAVIGLVFPALFHAVPGAPDLAAELRLSELVAGILVVTYGLSLVFSLKTHRALFGGGAHSEREPRWKVGPALAVLAVATAGVVIESEILVHAVEGVTAQLGLSEAFLGLVIIPLIGNAAEHATAVVVARKGQMDLAFQIALGSSTQIALLVAPLLVFAGVAMGVGMNLVFPVFEVLALAVSTLVIAIITLDGETHWFEGVQLLAVYLLLAGAAYFI